MDKKIIAGLYARVSTDDEKFEGTLETQINEARKYALDKGYEINENFVLTEQMTGTTLERPELKKIKHGAISGHIDMIIALVPDRLFRPKENKAVDYLKFLAEVKESGADVEFVKSQRAEGDFGLIMDAIDTISAGKERKAFLERTTRAKTKLAIDSEAPAGFGIGCYGYFYQDKKKDKQGTLISGGRRTINPDQAKIVKRIFQEVASGKSRNQIISDLNAEGIPTFAGAKWVNITVTRMIRNETYKGETIFRKTKRVSSSRIEKNSSDQHIVMKDFSPAIVSPEIWERANVTLNKRKVIRTKRNFLLSGFLECDNCGKNMTGHSQQKGRFLYYRCPDNSKALGSEGRCNTTSIKANRIDPHIQNLLFDLCQSPENIMTALSENQKALLPEIIEKIKKLEKALSKKEKERFNIQAMVIKGHMTQAEETKHFEQNEKDTLDLKVTLAELEAKRRKIEEVKIAGAEIEGWMIDMREALKENWMDRELIRRILNAFQIKILIGEDTKIYSNQFIKKTKPNKIIKILGTLPFQPKSPENPIGASINYTTTEQTSGCVFCKGITNASNSNRPYCQDPEKHLGLSKFQDAVERLEKDYYRICFPTDQDYKGKGEFFGAQWLINHKGTLTVVHSFAGDRDTYKKIGYAKGTH